MRGDDIKRVRRGEGTRTRTGREARRRPGIKRARKTRKLGGGERVRVKGLRVGVGVRRVKFRP